MGVFDQSLRDAKPDKIVDNRLKNIREKMTQNMYAGNATMHINICIPPPRPIDFLPQVSENISIIQINSSKHGRVNKKVGAHPPQRAPRAHGPI